MSSRPAARPSTSTSRLFAGATLLTALGTLFVYACGGGGSDTSPAGDGADASTKYTGAGGDGGTVGTSPTGTGTSPVGSAGDSGPPGGGNGDGGTTGDAGGTKVPRPADAYNLGMNLPSINYYNGAAIYADVSLQMAGNNGPWDSKANSGKAATLDATGAPTEAASAAFTSDYASGDYVMSWDGTGSFTIAGATLGTVTKTMVNGTQHNQVTVTWKQTLSSNSSPAFTGVTATPPVTNFHLVAPASLTEPTGMFMQDFATKMRPFTTVRFMDTLNTNGNTVQNWSDRTWPDEGSRGKPQGMAYEDIVAMANALGLDVWINVPVLATDDYVCRMARLFKYGEQGDKSNGACDPAAAAGAATTAKLNPSSKVYVEFSNEIWNTGFHQIHDVYCMIWGKTDNSGFPCDVTKPTSAIAAADLANTEISWSTDMGTKATQLAVFLARRDSTIFRTVFGCTSGAGCQAQIPYNVQAAYAAEVESGFALLKKTDGSLAALDAMAVAPYFNIDDDSTATSVDAVFTGLDANLASKPAANAGGAIANWLAGDLAEASKYDLPVIAYEGGQGLNGTTNEANLVAAETDPRMYDRYQTYLALWDSLVGRSHLFNHYSYVGGEGQYGSWGALIEQADPGSQKFDAMLSVTRAAGDADLDGVVDAADCAIAKANFGKTGLFWSQGDFNHDGTVDAKDLTAMNANISGAPCTQ
jgi:hypothetical protein